MKGITSTCLVFCSLLFLIQCSRQKAETTTAAPAPTPKPIIIKSLKISTLFNKIQDEQNRGRLVEPVKKGKNSVIGLIRTQSGETEFGFFSLPRVVSTGNHRQEFDHHFFVIRKFDAKGNMVWVCSDDDIDGSVNSGHLDKPPATQPIAQKRYNDGYDLGIREGMGYKPFWQQKQEEEIELALKILQ